MYDCSEYSKDQGGNMILPTESYGVPVFHVLSANETAAVLEGTPYPTPVFHIKRLKTEDKPIWRVTTDYSIGFTENMLQRSDVLQYMIHAQQFVDCTDIGTVRATVSRLLQHWSRKFPQGIPDSVM